MRAAPFACAAVLCLRAVAAAAQQAPEAAQETPEAKSPPSWEFSTSVTSYFVPQDRDYAQPTATADHGVFHVEARYNYEGIDTGSVWVGANFEFGKTVTVAITPMLGGVFGDTNGVAPGYHLTIGWKRLELYSEGEYLFDTDAHADSFFYNWNELTYAPFDWLRAGLVSQRTRVYQTPLAIQRGILVRGTVKGWTLSLYLFNFGWTDPTTVFSVGFEF